MTVKKRGRPAGPDMRYFSVGLPTAINGRLRRQIERMGTTLTGYVRQAVLLRLETDEATDPMVRLQDQAR